MILTYLQGTVQEILDRKDERNVQDGICKQLGKLYVLTREIVNWPVRLTSEIYDQNVSVRLQLWKSTEKVPSINTSEKISTWWEFVHIKMPVLIEKQVALCWNRGFDKD